MSTDGKFSDYVNNPIQDIFCSISCEITKQAAEFRSKVEDMICHEWGFERDDLIARLNELERIKKMVPKLEAERDEANSSLRHMMDENTELVKKLRATEDQLVFAHNEYARLCRNVEEEIKKCNKSYEDIVKENGRLRDDNKRLSRDRDAAIGRMEEACAKYHALLDRVETLAHRVDEALEDMIGAVHGL